MQGDSFRCCSVKLATINLDHQIRESIVSNALGKLASARSAAPPIARLAGLLKNEEIRAYMLVDIPVSCAISLAIQLLDTTCQYGSLEIDRDAVKLIV